ncbi:hypothetical protein B0H15DRAFT_927373 [Mycena belliarum]|uniref:Uncharacterized protein n=1 Tax=Mycena belliarum TaxID=1033014 RepID=A0AAD6XUG5_9AGAR|nr:hypothetical protein B0H15DRAFT_927373 [Mycena belliae]
MKAGPIKMGDSGLADVVLGGSGLEVQATTTLKSSRETHRVPNVLRVRVKVGQLKFRIRGSKHFGRIVKTLKPLAAARDATVREADQEGAAAGEVLSWARIGRDGLQGV